VKLSLLVYLGGILLVKNNLKSLLIHIIISIFSMIVYLLFNMAQPKWASAEAARNHHYSMMFVAITVIAVASILYYFLGSTRLISQVNIYRNLFSVSLILILGVFLWAYAFNIDRIGPSNRLLNSQLWQYYTMYNGYSFFLIEETGINNPYAFLFLSFIPTIAMWTGINRKRS
jgi:small-conductance mechanosensitive channel